MASKSTKRMGARLVLLMVVLAVAASAGVIDIATNNGQWYITSGAGVVSPTLAASVSGDPGPGNFTGGISFTSNGTSTGTFITGASAGNFDGFWTASFTFTLNTTSASLNFSNLYAQDRAVLYLNGTAIGNQIGSTGGGAGGYMSLTDVLASPYAFTLPIAGSNSALLNLTGSNTLTLVVNNTLDGTFGTGTAGFRSATDATAALLGGTVTFADGGTGVPEPASLSYLLIGLVPLALGFARRRR